LIATHQKWSDNLKVQFDERHLLNLKKEDLRNYYLVNAKPELKNGSWIYLFDSGAVFGKGTYIKGYRVGGWQFFHENGRIAQRGFYKNDGSRFHGNDEDAYLWKIYDEQGIEVADQPYNENWIEEAEEYLAEHKQRWSWAYE
jgi:antitoxin component YwqK of YwqJK toxin-antitoxin module